MGAGFNAFRQLEGGQLYADPYAGAAVGPRVQFFASASHAVAASSSQQIIATATLPDAIRSQQDGYIFDYLFAQFAPADTAGQLTLTDLETVIVPAASVVNVAYIAGAYPTLLTPVNASLVGFQNPPLITGAEMLFFARLLGGLGAFGFPQTGLRIALATSWKNADAANPHTMAVSIGGYVRKVTGVSS